MTSISVDVGSVDIYFDDIVTLIIDDCKEDEFLDELARHETDISKKCKDEREIAFFAEAGKRMHELAKWIRENQP